jgi:hypothetical protein
MAFVNFVVSSLIRLLPNDPSDAPTASCRHEPDIASARQGPCLAVVPSLSVRPPFCKTSQLWKASVDVGTSNSHRTSLRKWEQQLLAVRKWCRSARVPRQCAPSWQRGRRQPYSNELSRGDHAAIDQAECCLGSASATLRERLGSTSAQVFAAAFGDAEQTRFAS